VSLRSIDWFVTNYSKKNNIVIKNNGQYINVFQDYKNQLKGYSKKYFDPFRRNDRIMFKIENIHKLNPKIVKVLKEPTEPENEPVNCDHPNEIKDNHKIVNSDFVYDEVNNTIGFITTIAQLNFFKWAISNGIIKYIFENIDEIESDMINSIEHRYPNYKNKNDKRKQRKELSKCASKTIIKYHITKRIKFE
jgi:hypothetical protein